ncbi:MAG: tetratricopeptide repeat protein [Pontiellaceae bacterium]|nr:tetratricopeptide repeat protein [Pontiellaceae bacterium]
MRCICCIILLSAFCFSAVAQESVPPVPELPAERFPSIRASLEDGFYSLAEYQAQEVLRGEPDAAAEKEVQLLLARALWGQKRYADLLQALDGADRSAESAYWRARAFYGLKQYDDALEVIAGAEQDDLPSEPWGASMLRLKGRVQEESGRLDEAVTSYSLFAQTYTNHIERVDNQFDLAATYQLLGKTADAVGVYEALTADEEASVARRAQLELGRTLLAAGDDESLERARTQLAELGADVEAGEAIRVDACLELAALENRLGQVEKAKDVLQKAIELAPVARLRVQLKRELAQVCLLQGQYAEALKLLEECRAEAPDERIAAELQLEKAGALLRAERYSEAEQAYQVYLNVASDPSGVAQAYLGRALALLGGGRYSEAGLLFDKAVEALPSADEKADALIKAGDAYFQAQKLEEAEQRYRSFIQQYPDHYHLSNALYHLGLVLQKIGRSADAIEVFSLVETEHADSPFAEKAALRIVDVMLANKQWEESLLKYEEIAQTYTNAATVALCLHQRGIVLFNYLLRYDEAQTAFEAVLENYPESAYASQAAYMRGVCLYAQGHVDEAVEIYKKYIKDFPDSEWTPEVLFLLAEHYYNQGNYVEAESCFLQIFNGFKKHRLAPDALCWAGRSAAAESNYVKAIEYYGSVEKNYPDADILSQVRFAEGDALSQLGRFSEAITVFNKILESGLDDELVNAAWGRKGDCLFSLADEKAEGYESAKKAYQAILDRPSASAELKMMAEYKVGRCQESLNMPDNAFSRYMRVVYSFKDSEERTPFSIMWFTRSAMGAAAIKERQREWVEAVNVYERVVEAQVPARIEALKRIERIKSENWLLFQQSEWVD